MKAKRKTLEVIQADTLDVDLTSRTELLKVEEPAKREAGIVVGDVSELVNKLKNEAKVIS
jgi:electron transfer flavoprotein beta subunit